MALIMLDYQAVQKRVEVLLEAAAAAVVATGAITAVHFGESAPDDAALWVRLKGIRFMGTPRQRAASVADSQQCVVTLEAGIADSQGNPARSAGSTHALAYIATAMRMGFEGTSQQQNGLTTSFNKVDVDLGNMVDSLTAAPLGLILVYGEAHQETATAIVAPGGSVDPAPGP